MKLIPINKYLLVEKEEDQVSHLVPEEYRDNLSPFSIVKVLDMASDCEKITLQPERSNMKIIVQTNGIEKIKTLRDTFYIVSEKFVVGILEQQ